MLDFLTFRFKSSLNDFEITFFGIRISGIRISGRFSGITFSGIRSSGIRYLKLDFRFVVCILFSLGIGSCNEE